MTKQLRQNRNIRLNDDEWKIFREELGAEWLRAQIAKAKAKKSRADVSAIRKVHSGIDHG